jgi:16S rRNA processing protein RimM
VEKFSDPVVIGVVVAPHGVRGTVRVRPTGSGRHLRENVEPLVGERRRRIVRSRPTPKGFLVDLEGVGDRSEAVGLKGEKLVLDRAELDPTGEDEFYVRELVGLTAVSDTGGVVGTVEETFETLAHEILVVRREEEVLYVPFTFEHVPEVDLPARRVVIRPPEA